MTGRYFFSVILLICVATATAQDEDHPCVRCFYTLVTKTGIQADGATRGAHVDLFFNYTNPDIISDISRFSIMGTESESFQNDTLDVFIFAGPCEHYCEAALVFRGSAANSWNLDFFVLGACRLRSAGCGVFRTYHVNGTFHGPLSTRTFNFCGTGAGTEKVKLTGPSLLPLVGMPSYTT